MTPEEAARQAVAYGMDDEPQTPNPWMVGIAFALCLALAFGGVAWWVEAIVRWVR